MDILALTCPRASLADIAARLSRLRLGIEGVWGGALMFKRPADGSGSSPQGTEDLHEQREPQGECFGPAPSFRDWSNRLLSSHAKVFR